MRVIGYIEHPTLKITVFATDNRFPVQFENGNQAQIYRLRKGQGMENLQDVKAFVDAAFCQAVATTMSQMGKIEAMAYQRWSSNQESNSSGVLPNII